MEGPTSFPALLAPMVQAGTARIVRDEITFSNGSRISLNHCQHETDKYRYQGAEFHVLAFDELTHFTESQYRYLRGRLRMTGVDAGAYAHLFPRIISGANPGGVGHVWVRRTFVRHGLRAYRTPPKEGGLVRQYIPARLADNPALTTSDPNYIDRLEGLGDPTLVRAMKEGDWNIVAGAKFGAQWRNDRHTCQPFPIPHDWPIWVGADDGFAAPACMVWMTEDPQYKTLYAIGEVYKSGMMPDDFAARAKATNANILRIDQADRNAEPTANTDPVRGYLDGAAFADTGQQGPNGQKTVPRGNALVAAGLKLKPAPKWPGSRIHRAQELHRLLGPNPKDPQKRPGLIFFTTCKHCIETIPALPADKHQPEDVDTDAEDHAYDAVGYGIQHKRGKPGKLKVDF